MRFGIAKTVVMAAVVLGVVIAAVVVRSNGYATQAPAAAPKQLWTCSMHPQVIQDQPGRCPICQMELVPKRGRAPTSAPARAERKVKYWWDPMLGANSISDKPGKSAMGMDLVPVFEDQPANGSEVVIDPVVEQNMGLRIGEVTKGPLIKNMRVFGVLKEAESRQSDVNLRVSGWIEKLYANYQGMHVKRGDALFDLYSPQLQVGVDELIAARKASAPTTQQADRLAGSSTRAIYQAAERKLRLLGLDEKQIESLARLDQAPRTITFRSPVMGHVIEKPVVEGSAVTEGQKVLRIVDHSELWLDAQVFEDQSPFVRIGLNGSATVQGVPGKQFDGQITFIHPHVDTMMRTLMVRLVISNESLTLRPGMYATVTIDSKLSDDAILVPTEAVIDTGVRQIVFVAKGEGRFQPRTIKTGAANRDGTVQVLEGLQPGEKVVTSGQFLLDSESNLREAIQKRLNEKLAQRAASPEKGEAK